MENINKLKKSYNKAVMPVVTEIYKELEMNKYDDIWRHKLQIFAQARRAEKSKELQNLILNFADMINYYNSVFKFKEILVLDKDDLLELFPGTIKETKDLMSIFQKEKIMPELNINQLEAQIKQINNLSNKEGAKGLVYTLYKLIIYLTFYKERIAASAYAEFLYDQYLICKGNYTSEFSMGGGRNHERLFDVD